MTSIILTFILSALIYFPVNSGAGGLYFTGLWRFENFIQNLMKLSEDQEIKIIEPTLFVGSYQETEVRPSTEDFKLSEVKDWQPLELELIFRSNGQTHSGRISPREGSVLGTNHLLFYKREIEKQLIGKTWSEALQYDFKFDKASKLD